MPDAHANISYGDHYSSRCTWRKRDLHVTLTVPSDWRVRTRGIEVVDEMLTLDAEPIDAPAGFRAWQATWVRQGRGSTLVVERGLIVRSNRSEETTHARELATAVGQLRARNRARLLDQIDPTRPEYRDVRVRVGGSSRAGNCPSGTADWVERHFSGHSSVTVAEIAEVEDRRHLALAACRVAILRHLRKQENGDEEGMGTR
jgi:hypothetical protein